jgi:hypothetical protein
MDDTPNKALEAVVKALGGSKKVAPLLWPEKGVEEARRLLCDCLNDERPAKLDFAQVLFILRLARRQGVHDGMQFVCAHLGYSEAQPIEPEDERAQLQRQFVQGVGDLSRLVDRIERLQPVRAVA